MLSHSRGIDGGDLHFLMQSGSLSQMLKFYRKQSGLTQRHLADLAGIGRTVVVDIENGKQTINLQTFLQILKVLNISCFLKPPLSSPKGGDQ